MAFFTSKPASSDRSRCRRSPRGTVPYCVSERHLVCRSDRQFQRLHIQMRQEKRRCAGVVQHQVLAQCRVPVIDAIYRSNLEGKLILFRQPHRHRLSTGDRIGARVPPAHTARHCLRKVGQCSGMRTPPGPRPPTYSRPVARHVSRLGIQASCRVECNHAPDQVVFESPALPRLTGFQ